MDEEERLIHVTRLHRAASEYLVDAMVGQGVVSILHSLDRSEDYERQVIGIMADPREEIVSAALMGAIKGMRALYIKPPEDRS